MKNTKPWPAGERRPGDNTEQESIEQRKLGKNLQLKTWFYQPLRPLEGIMTRMQK